MQPIRSTNLAEAVTGEAPGLYSQWVQQDSLDTIHGSGLPLWKNMNNNVSFQTGEEFSMKFLQECAASSVQSAVRGVAPNYEERVGVVQDRQMVYEELARVLGLGRMDSECGSDITEFASARGSTTHIDNGVYLSDGSTHYKDIASNGHKPSKSSIEVSNDQDNLAPTFSLLSESDSSRSLYFSGLGVSDGSQSGKIKLLCSFCGKILPRPSDGKLRYVGGQTRIISISKNISWEELVKKTAGMCNQPHTIKYQLPGEDLDALISVSSDEDLQNMIDEYYGAENPEASQRLRIFLIPLGESETSYTLDASIVQPSNMDYQYVVAVNGIAGTEPIPQKNYNGQPSDSEMVHLVPNAESSLKYEKIFPLPVHPSENKNAPDLTEFFNESEKLISSPSLTHVPVQQLDVRNANTTMYKSNSALGSTEGPVLFSRISTSIPLPAEDSIGCPASHHQTPQLAMNLMKSSDPINKNEVIHPNITSQLILKVETVVPQRLEQKCSNFELCSEGGVVLTERTFNSENPLPQTDNSTDILPGPGDSVSCYHAIPHAFSDSKLQEQGQISACSSQNGMSQSFSLNLGRPQSSSCRVSAALLEKAVQLNEDVGLINTQLQTKALIVEPTMPVTGVVLLNSASGSEGFSKFEPIRKDINCDVGKDQLVKEDLRNQNPKVKPHENDFVANFELMNKCDANSHLLSGGNFFSISEATAVPVSGPCLQSPEQGSEVLLSLAPASSCVGFRPLNDSELEKSQNNYFGKLSTAVANGDPESHSSCANNSEVAGIVHSSQDQSHDNVNYSGLLNGLSNGLVSPKALLGQSLEGSRDTGCQEVRVRGCEDLDRPKGVDNAGWSNIPHNSAILRREVSLLDDDLANHTDNRVEKADYVGISNEHQKLQDGPLLNNINECKKKPGPVVQDAEYNLSGAQFPSTTVPNLSDAANDGNAIGHEDELFSDAMIAEMEADIYGLQIIKNADLEELRELGSGTYGTVYYGKWRGTDVAIKRLKKACFSGRSSEQERLTKDFWREARILSNLHHPNVVAFYGVVPDGAGGTLATVTEFMANGSLRTALIKKDKFLDHRKKLIIAMDAAFGMEYLHSKNIVHFDLKCDNLLVNLRDPQRPICKVGDFGLSRIKRNTLVSGGVRGTLPWMAPELLNGSTTRVSEKVDVFSFGITLWEILTGEEPYANMHCGAIIGGIVKNTLRPPIPEQCDPEWRKLMEECWSAEPEARPSFTEITYRLRSMSAALQTKGQPNLMRQLKPNISM
ncbi:putative serine/threonine-protein kinase DDB [Sesamum alatum]|uniref:Serine/threonine-protein kinase DDB n=1 Tax=Sesamum alatum TaxID=300844 RepID=A0AAE1Z3F4_9LAMI|nr:putative serine/threonine-protein kinase DDB [Sesamum alatum]